MRRGEEGCRRVREGNGILGRRRRGKFGRVRNGSLGRFGGCCGIGGRESVRSRGFGWVGGRGLSRGLFGLDGRLVLGRGIVVHILLLRRIRAIALVLERGTVVHILLVLLHRLVSDLEREIAGRILLVLLLHIQAIYQVLGLETLVDIHLSGHMVDYTSRQTLHLDIHIDLAQETVFLDLVIVLVLVLP